MEHKYIEIKGLSKIFTRKKESVHALENIDFSVDRGELVCILGPSGCGKSTLLRAICGLDTEHSGDVFIDGRKVIKPEKTRGMVFQEHRLFPWLTVEENVAFALNGVDKDTKAELVQQHIDLVGLTGFEKSYLLSPFYKMRPQIRVSVKTKTVLPLHWKSQRPQLLLN